MQIIHKYVLCQDVEELTLPADFRILKLAELEGRATLWIMHNIDDNAEGDGTMTIRVVYRGTGHYIEDSDSLFYIDTIVTDAGLVWHYFYEYV